MAGKRVVGKGFLERLFENLRTKKKVQQEQISAGKDYMGNMYYEAPADPSRGVRAPKRWYWPQHEDDWDRPIPPEWEAWLRYRRPDAPTEEEINRNIAMAQLKRLRAKEATERLSAMSREEVVSTIEKEKIEANVAKNPQAPSQSSDHKSIFDRFPKYEDLETNPGEDVTKSRKKDERYDS